MLRVQIKIGNKKPPAPNHYSAISVICFVESARLTANSAARKQIQVNTKAIAPTGLPHAINPAPGKRSPIAAALAPEEIGNEAWWKIAKLITVRVVHCTMVLFWKCLLVTLAPTVGGMNDGDTRLRDQCLECLYEIKFGDLLCSEIIPW